MTKPHDAGTPLRPAWYQPPQPVPSSQQESHFWTLPWQKTGSANACIKPLSKSEGQMTFNEESSSQIWSNHTKAVSTKNIPKKHGIHAVDLEVKKNWLYQIVLVTPSTYMKPNCRNTGLAHLLESGCQAAIAGSLQQRVPGLARWCPSELSWKQLEPVWSSSEKFETDWSSLEKFETVWSSLKQCETVWSSLKQCETVWSSLKQCNSLKHSETVWSQSQCYMVQLRSLTTQGLHFSLLSINLLNLSRRHSRNHTFILFDSIVVANESLIFELLSASKCLVFLGFWWFLVRVQW